MNYIEYAIIDKLNIYIIPPFLSLLASLIIIFIALIKSKLKFENILFIILCVWWSLLSPVFICHHLLKGNEILILQIEKIVHFFFVYTPAICLFYCFRITKTRNRLLVRGAFILSFLISLTTPTDYYMPGLIEYSWGYMAQGGIAFIIFGTYAAAVWIYLIIFFIRKIKPETNLIIRLKLKFIMVSFLISAFLLLMNYPAIVGIDFYPLGNFSFIPLSFLAYGVLRYRLLDFRNFFQITTVWAALSTLLAMPNIIIIYLVSPYIKEANYGIIFTAGLIWFFINYYYFRRVQPLIDRFFNKRKLELLQIESNFTENIYSLKTFDDLVLQFTEVLRNNLFFKNAELVLCDTGIDTVPGFESDEFILSPGFKKWITVYNDLLDSDITEYLITNLPISQELLALFETYKAKYIVPLIHNDILIALLFLSEKKNRKPLTPDESRLIKNIKTSVSISLANSIMYSDLSKLKESLDVKVKEKTADLEKSMEALHGVVDNLEKGVQDKVISFFTRKKIEETITYIEKNYSEEISRGSLAKLMNMNSDYLGRMFKKLTEKNIADFINECRLKKACELLINSDDTIADIAFSVGFESLPTFYRVFKKMINEAPVNYRGKYQKSTS